MREIKFRAWDIIGNQYYPNVQNHIGNFDTAFGNMIIDSRYIIEQFTGLQEKNGKDIYEGDIVKYEDRESVINSTGPDKAGYVCWDEHDLCWSINNNKGNMEHLAWAKGCIEVIGNIHENPELLKDKT